MSILTFGPGNCSIRMIEDADANTIAIPQPFPLSAMQGLEIGYERETKEFYGKDSFALHIAPGKIKMPIKITGPIPPDLSAQIIGGFTDSATRGGIVRKGAPSRQITATAGQNAALITVALPTGGEWADDMGLMLDDGTPMLKVDATPTGIEYTLSVAEDGSQATYHVDSALVGRKFVPSYTYDITGKGLRYALANLEIGQAPVFALDYRGKLRGIEKIVSLSRIIITKVKQAGTKLDDFDICDLEGQAYADPGAPAGMVYSTRRGA
jgi:hypothetical protein